MVVESKVMEKTDSELEFTGNWFIDSGILGFVNLMEEVYGWDLEELQKRLLDEPNAVFYWYFPIAYVYYNNKLRKKIDLETPSPPRDVENCAELFERAWEWILDREEFEGVTSKSKEKRVDLSFKKPFNYFTNFLFFQPDWNAYKQKDAFMEILGLKNLKSDVLIYIDKTINKFLSSKEEFGNISYTKSSITLETLLAFNPRSLLFLLCFPLGFIDLEDVNVIFYSPELNFTYQVNKKLKKMLDVNKSNRQILQIVLGSVLDSILETQSIWTLENMYLIKYRLGGKQDVLNAEYIGIQKLQATFLIDDTIRESLNLYYPVQIKKINNKVYIHKVWLIEEFIKNKPLLPIITRYIHLRLNAEDVNIPKFSKKKLLYPVLVDAKVTDIHSKKEDEKRIFDDSFFDRFRRAVEEVKEDFKRASSISKLFLDLFDLSEIENYVRTLFELIKRSQKFSFVNSMLKILNQKREKDLDKIKLIMNYLFEKILNNEFSWKNYAVIFIIAFLVKGESDERELESGSD